MFAKVKNHATVQRAPHLSTGTSDYIHAGTQVLLNTLSLVLLPHQAPFPLSAAPPSPSSPPVSPSPPQVGSRYKSLFAVQVPPHVGVPPLVPCSVLSQKSGPGRQHEAPQTPSPLNQDVAPPSLGFMSPLRPLCEFVCRLSQRSLLMNVWGRH